MKKNILKGKILKEDAYNLEDYKSEDIKPCISNTMFEAMINNESRKKYLCYILSFFIDKDIDYIMDNITFLKNELNQESIKEYGKTVDLVVDVDNISYNIELNNNSTKDELYRNIEYAFHLSDINIKSNKRYIYKECKQINICNFSFEGLDNPIIGPFTLKDNENNELTDKVEIYYILLPKVRKKMYNKEELTNLEKFMLALNEKDDNLIESLEGDRILEDYRKDAYSASKDQIIAGLYDKELEEKRRINSRIDEALERGIEKGIEQGINNNKIEIAKNLLKMGQNIDFIIQATGLTEEIIKDLQKNI